MCVCMFVMLFARFLAVALVAPLQYFALVVLLLLPLASRFFLVVSMRWAGLMSRRISWHPSFSIIKCGIVYRALCVWKKKGRKHDASIWQLRYHHFFLAENLYFKTHIAFPLEPHIVNHMSPNGWKCKIIWVCSQRHQHIFCCQYVVPTATLHHSHRLWLQVRALIAAAFISVQPNNEHIENAPPIELSNTPPHFFFAVASIVKLKWIPILTVAQESTFLMRSRSNQQMHMM